MKARGLGILMFSLASVLTAQSAGTFQLSLLPGTLGDHIGEPLPCPPGVACENYVPIYVDRVGGTTGAVSVDLVVTGGSANAYYGGLPFPPGADYYLAGAHVTFGDGLNQRQQVFLVPIQDHILEGDETAILALANPTGGATIGTPSNVTITITDTSGLAGAQGVPALGPVHISLLVAAVGAAGVFVLARRTT